MKRRENQLEMTKRTPKSKLKHKVSESEDLNNLNDESTHSLILDYQHHHHHDKLIPNVKKDIHNIALLMFLYLLQGKFETLN